ncbi:MAG TPA: hypothetical protein VKA48_04945 [Gammaproteobacteria bacterium]|nr:hypothetical protein [Gammaproteobacteria bacterium]
MAVIDSRRSCCAWWRAIAALVLFLGLAGLAGAGGSEVADPTRPPGTTGGEAPKEPSGGGSLSLQSILHGRGRLLAIISGHTVQVGDRLGDYTVQNILQDRVVLSGGGGTRILRIGPTAGLQKVPSN